MKTKVIEFFQNLPEAPHEQFNQAFALYRESEGKNQAIERAVNARGYSPSTLDNLLYDLQKLHGITDVEKVSIPVVDIGKKVTNYSENDLEVISNLSDDEILRWSKGEIISFEEIKDVFDYAVSVENHEAIAILTKIIALIEQTPEDSKDGVLQLNPNSEVPGTQEQTADVSTEVPPVSTEPNPVSTEAALKEENETLKSENEDLQFEKEELENEKEELEDENEELKAEVETLKLAPKLDATQIRVEFPFLNNKDCPDELKILVTDKITAWNFYLGCQYELARIESGEIVETDLRKADLAKNAIDAFTENQKIYDELNAYQTTGKVLGLHPIFKKLQLTREVETMTNEELIKYKSASAKYFSDNKGLLAKAVKAKNETRVLEIQNRVAEREVKLALVNKKLGVK